VTPALRVAAIWAATICLLTDASPESQRPAIRSRDGTAVPQGRAARHIALLIGVAHYKNFPDSGGEPGKTRLYAPVANDLPRMQKSLERWGFAPGEDVRVLTDSAASRAGIEAGFKWLIERANDTSDVVVIYYSGHGSWARDRDGDEAKVDPNDRADEALVPWDASDIHDPRQLVIDDEIRDWLARMTATNVTVIVDACFSGTITRGITRARARGPVGGPAAPSSQSALDALSPRHTLITAATSGQTASELPFATATGEREFGVLTFFLSRAMDAADSSIRYDELVRRVRSEMVGLTGRISPQDPQLEGDRGALLFRVRRPFAPRPIATITNISAGHLTIDVGAVNGVRVGAVYDVYQPGETRFDDSAPRPHIEVDSVGETRSFARMPVQRVQGASIAVGARLVLALVPAGARTVNRLTVRLDPDMPGVRKALAALSFVRLVDSSAQAVVRATAGMARVEVSGQPLPPLLNPRDQIATVGRETGFVPSETGLCPPLRRAFGIAALRAVDNPAAPYIPVQLRLVRPGTTPPAGESTGVDTVVIGQRYSLFAKVSAPVTSTLYLTIAVAGYASEPTVLYPLRGQSSEQFPLNRWELIQDSILVEEPAGFEVLKAVVSSRPFDLRPLIGALPNCAERGSRGGSSVWNPPPEPVTGWATTERPVTVVRGPVRSK